MRKIFTLISALAILGMLATSALAAVTFNPATGTGFIGKGDVQLAFEWNNKALNNNIGAVAFTYEVEGTYTYVCSRVHSRHGYQEQTFPNKVTSLNSELEHELRNNKKGAVTGIRLVGFGDVVASGEGCPSGWPTEVSATPNEGAGNVVGVFAHYDDGTTVNSVQLDWAPAVE